MAKNIYFTDAGRSVEAENSVLYYSKLYFVII